jgi:hypothetical protein
MAGGFCCRFIKYKNSFFHCLNLTYLLGQSVRQVSILNFYVFFIPKYCMMEVNINFTRQCSKHSSVFMHTYPSSCCGGYLNYNVRFMGDTWLLLEQIKINLQQKGNFVEYKRDYTAFL